MSASGTVIDRNEQERAGRACRGAGLCQPDLEIREATAADEPVFPPARSGCHEVPQAF
jgi:hypothetical protein